MLTIIELTVSALDNQVVLDDGRGALGNHPVDGHTAAIADNVDGSHGDRLCCDADEESIGS